MEIKIIIADDHTIIRDGLKLILESHSDLKVIAEAENGLQVISKANELQPDVILMDIAMPNMNGVEATRRIIEENPSIRIIILSMHSTVEDIFRSLQAGAKGYLVKESAGTEVVDAVRAVFNGRRYLSRKVDDILIDSYIHEHQLSEADSPLERLSSREREVLQLVAEGKSSSEISDLLYLSVKTIETYRSRTMQKLGIKDLTGLVKFAIQQRLTA
jgi:DNA-binding NarL/FixJ family response regulator